LAQEIPPEIDNFRRSTVSKTDHSYKFGNTIAKEKSETFRYKEFIKTDRTNSKSSAPGVPGAFGAFDNRS